MPSCLFVAAPLAACLLWELRSITRPAASRLPADSCAQVFAELAPVESARVVGTQCYAFVRFASPDAATAVIEVWRCEENSAQLTVVDLASFVTRLSHARPLHADCNGNLAQPCVFHRYLYVDVPMLLRRGDRTPKKSCQLPLHTDCSQHGSSASSATTNEETSCLDLSSCEPLLAAAAAQSRAAGGGGRPAAARQLGCRPAARVEGSLHGSLLSLQSACAVTSCCGGLAGSLGSTCSGRIHLAWVEWC